MAVRAEDDVIVFDVCGPDYDFSEDERPLTKVIYKNGDLTPGFTVEEEYGGKFYIVRFIAV